MSWAQQLLELQNTFTTFIPMLKFAIIWWLIVSAFK